MKTCLKTFLLGLPLASSGGFLFLNSVFCGKIGKTQQMKLKMMKKWRKKYGENKRSEKTKIRKNNSETIKHIKKT